jgi:AAA+ ATPase superfamily predicted ATPase
VLIGGEEGSMTKEIQNEALLHLLRAEKACERYNQNTEIAFQWTDDPAEARWIAEAVEEYRNILIMGPLASGKTKLLNELLRMSLPEDRFRYIYRSENGVFNDYELHREFHSRVEYAINLIYEPFHMVKRGIPTDQPAFWEKPKFYVIDDIDHNDLITITSRVKRDLRLPMIATIQFFGERDLHFIDTYLKQNFDVFIILNRYKEVSHVLFSDSNK